MNELPKIPIPDNFCESADGLESEDMVIIELVNKLMDAIPYRDLPERRKEIIRGKWRWIGHASHAVHLVTEKGGQQYLLSTMRKGFNGSQFQVRADGGGYGIMEPASKFYVSRASYDPENIVDIDNPICQLIKLIPDMVRILNEQVNQIDNLKAELVQSKHEVEDIKIFYYESKEQKKTIDRLHTELAKMQAENKNLQELVDDEHN